MGSRHLPLLLLLVAFALFGLASSVDALDVCIGDCDSSGAVSIAELLTGVNIALDLQPLTRCESFDTDANGKIAVNELLGAVHGAVDGCRPPDPTPTAVQATPTVAEPTPTATPEEFVAEAEDFDCLTEWTHIRHFRIANKLGHLDEALAVANGDAPPPYPVGTIIQLVPQEAVVKRGGGFFPEANDWEFFSLAVSPTGTQIRQRGRGEVVNIGPPCFACHSAASQTDLVCETDNGCIALNLSEDLINALQNGDPRCAAPTPAAAH
jgi:hypothetical protein